jgi:hypothetical protein
MLRKILIAAILLLVVFFVTCIATKKNPSLKTIINNNNNNNNNNNIISISISNRGMDSIPSETHLYKKDDIDLFVNLIKEAEEFDNKKPNINFGLAEGSLNLEGGKKITFLIINTTYYGVAINYEDDLWKTHYYRNDKILLFLKGKYKDGLSR